VQRRVVVQLSGGIPSWVTARLCCERYGQDNVTLLFADTLIEDEDLYRFLADVEQDTQLDVSFIGNSRVDPCSLNLKRLLLKRWIVEHCDPATTVVAIGIDWTEIDRCERITAGQLPFTAVYPLIDAGLDKDQCFQVAAERGIKPPRLYDLGFPHNNCGGFCV
jgi:PP-loop superfamily ATP-utilizing enzyme